MGKYPNMFPPSNILVQNMKDNYMMLVQNMLNNLNYILSISIYLLRREKKKKKGK